jgi:glycosyltransferase involved in cell wall biosynthesis
MLFDVFAGNNYSWTKRVVARYTERRILRAAELVLVTNAATREHYRRLYGIDSVVIEHPAPLHEVVDARPVSAQPVIGYTGSIYWAQRDALKVLVESLDQIPPLRLQIVSDVNLGVLARMGLLNDRVDVAYADLADVNKYQRRADVLYLPLAFGTEALDVIRTATPGKLADYLVAGVPILVHAPAYSHIARDAREHGWGLVVDTLDPAALVVAVRALLDDQLLRQSLVGKAFAIARSRHDRTQVGLQFRRALDSIVRRTDLATSWE